VRGTSSRPFPASRTRTAATAAEWAEAEQPALPGYLASVFLVQWQRYSQADSLESAKRQALSLVTGIPTPSVADRARVVSPTWSEPDFASPYRGKLRPCQKMDAVYERAAVRAQEAEEALPLAAYGLRGAVARHMRPLPDFLAH
jgi:hypothetical protein